MPPRSVRDSGDVCGGISRRSTCTLGSEAPVQSREFVQCGDPIANGAGALASYVSFGVTAYSVAPSSRVEAIGGVRNLNHHNVYDVFNRHRCWRAMISKCSNARYWTRKRRE